MIMQAIIVIYWESSTVSLLSFHVICLFPSIWSTKHAKWKDKEAIKLLPSRMVVLPVNRHEHLGHGWAELLVAASPLVRFPDWSNGRFWNMLDAQRKGKKDGGSVKLGAAYVPHSLRLVLEVETKWTGCWALQECIRPGSMCITLIPPAHITTLEKESDRLREKKNDSHREGRVSEELH